MTIRNLEYLFKPRSIAVIGAGKQPDGVDSALEFNLIEGGFKGPVMPVNPDRQSISGVLAYKNIESLPVTPDLAILTVPLEQTPALISQLGARGTRAALLISREMLQDHRGDRPALLSPELQQSHPDDGETLRQRVLDAAKPYLLRIMGPDHLGYAVPSANVNASLSSNRPLAGHVALLCQ